MKNFFLLLLLTCTIFSNSFAIQPPGNILSPSNGETDVSIQPTFEIDSSTWSTRIEILIATDSSFSNVLLEDNDFYNTVYQINSIAKALSFNETYYVKFRYFSDDDSSEYSDFVEFSTVATPTFTSPSDSSYVYTSPQFTWLGNFCDMQISIVDEDTTSENYPLIFDIRGFDHFADFEQNIAFRNAQLEPNTTYICQIRQNDTVYGVSDWSDPLVMVTEPPQPSPPLVEPLEPDIENGPSELIDFLEESELTPTDNTRDITSNPTVGSIEGQLTVNPTGAAGYSIPIWCPEGVNGMQPNITIEYSSQSSSQLVGWGWSIGGMSSIFRIPENRYTDGKISEISTLNDGLIGLDGNRLIYIEETNTIYGQIGARYTTLNGNGFRIVQKGGSLASLNAWFEVTDKDGNIYEYGETSDSKFRLKETDDPENQHNVEWRLNKVTDINGNYITYEYYDEWDGMNLLKKISYTMNDAQSVTSPFALLEFQYQQKAIYEKTIYIDDDDYYYYDRSEYYNGGLMRRDNSVLTEIIVKYEDVAVKAYKFDYYFDEYTQLHSIREKAFNYDEEGTLLGTTHYNETVFDYYNEPPKMAFKDMGALPVGVNDDDYTIHFGDFNGDGIKDRLIIDRKENSSNGEGRAIGYLQWGEYFECNGTTYECSGSINYTDATNNPQFDVPDYLLGYYRLDNSNITIADFNNDGMDDLLLPFLDVGASRIYETLRDWAGAFKYSGYRIYSGSSSSLNLVADHFHFFDRTPQSPMDPEALLFFGNEKYMLADYDEDGMMELVWQSHYYLHDKLHYCADQIKMYYYEIIDENGDFIYSYSGLPEDSPKDIGTVLFGTHSKIDKDSPNFMMFEAITDGKPEFLLASPFDEQDDENNDFANNGIWSIEYDENNNPSLEKTIPLDFQIENNNIIVADFNGDGYSDILYADITSIEELGGFYHWYIKYWQGNGFIRSQNQIRSLSGLNNWMDDNYHSINIGDVNGDGIFDVLRSSSWKINVECNCFPFAGWSHIVQENLSHSIININTQTNSLVGAYYWYQDFCGVSYIGPEGTWRDEFALNRKTIKRMIKDGFWSDDYANEKTHRQLLTDLNGDGNADFLNGEYLLMVNPEQHTRHLKSISDGYNNKTTISYKPISSGEVSNDPTMIFRKELSESNSDQKIFNAGSWVVSKVEKTKSGDVTPSLEIDYTYGKAIFHKKKGFLGFEEFFTRIFDEKNSSSYTETRQFYSIFEDEANKIYEPYLERELVFRNGNQIGEYRYVKDKYLYANGNYSIFNQTVEKFDFLNEARSITSYNFSNDESRNLESEEMIITTCTGDPNNPGPHDYVSRVKKLYSYDSFGCTWEGIPIKNKVTSVTEESQIYDSTPLDDPFSQKTSFDYYDGTEKYKLKDLIIYPTTEKALKTTYVYDGFGNIDKTIESQTFDNSPAREISYTYDSRNRFLTSESLKVSDTEFLTSSWTYNDIYGTVESEVDYDGNTNTMTYNEFGRLIKETDIYGVSLSIQLNWSTDPNYLFEVVATNSYGPNLWTYYDGLGKRLLNKKETFGPVKILQAAQYHPDGRLIQSSYPYFEGQSPGTKIISKEYDSYLRTKKSINQGNTTEFFFGKDQTGATGLKRFTTVKTPDGKETTTKTNEAGILIESYDSFGNLVAYDYESDLKTAKINTVAMDSEQLTMEVQFNQYGLKERLIDQDAGQFEYEYNAFSQVTKETNNNGFNEFEYDRIGRIKIKKHTGTDGVVESIAYNYVPSGSNGAGNVGSIIGPGSGDSQTFSYDLKGRIGSIIKTINNENYHYLFNYNNFGQIETKTYPSGLILEYIYDSNGYLFEIMRMDFGAPLLVWRRIEQDEFGHITKYQLADDTNPISCEISFDDFNMIDKIVTSTLGNIGDVQNWDYDFNSKNGNLNQRIQTINGITQTEKFGYDILDRLEVVKDANDLEKLRISFHNDGSMVNKSDVGNYFYDDKRDGSGNIEFPTHAVKRVSSNLVMKGHVVTSNSFNSVETIKSCDILTEFYYYANENRNQMDVSRDSDGDGVYDLEYSKFYLGDYEKIVKVNGDIKEISYIETPTGISAAVINEVISNTPRTDDFYFIHADNLGSIEALSNQNGQIIPNARFSYDAWGRLRNPSNWDDEIPIANKLFFEILDRGFTGHEHLKEHNLINMNGRVYDQLLAQFIQPDNNIVLPENSQSYNRYSYVLNNPLKYTDPSGEYPRGNGYFSVPSYGQMNSAIDAYAMRGLNLSIYSYNPGNINYSTSAQFNSTANAGIANSKYSSDSQSGNGGTLKGDTYEFTDLRDFKALPDWTHDSGEFKVSQADLKRLFEGAKVSSYKDLAPFLAMTPTGKSLVDHHNKVVNDVNVNVHWYFDSNVREKGRPWKPGRRGHYYGPGIRGAQNPLRDSYISIRNTIRNLLGQIYVTGHELHHEYQFYNFWELGWDLHGEDAGKPHNTQRLESGGVDGVFEGAMDIQDKLRIEFKMLRNLYDSMLRNERNNSDNRRPKKTKKKPKRPQKGRR
jgi:RHS repeat-associated protein